MWNTHHAPQGGDTSEMGTYKGTRPTKNADHCDRAHNKQHPIAKERIERHNPDDPTADRNLARGDVIQGTPQPLITEGSVPVTLIQD